MEIIELKSLICLNRHCFDISKNGYVNFLMKHIKTEYDKVLFNSRNIISRHGFFEPLTEAIAEIISKETDASLSDCMILDAGCGEGSHLNQIINKLNASTQARFQGVGIDISKGGIQIASRQYPDCIWCVGDLAGNPFMSGIFDIILNILSPSNYAEFHRLLKDSGLLVKAVPGKDYLKELREALYHHTDKQSYSNEKVLQHFTVNFNFLATRQVRYTKKLDEEMLMHLFKMTPLTWMANDDEIMQALNAVRGGITADFVIIYGKKH